MSKIEQLNELLSRELALAIKKKIELPEVFITISYISCSPDLKQAKVAVSVFPDKMAGTALRKLKANSGKIISEIIKRTRLRKLPHLLWNFDPTERKAANLEKIFLEIKQE